MGKKVHESTKKAEASALLSLISERWNGSHSSFAAACERTRAELKQHLECIRPIPLPAVKAYAKVLGCSVGDISERWAKELIGEQQSAAKQDGPKEDVDTVITWGRRKSDAHPAIAEIIKLMQEMDEAGKWILVGTAREVAKNHAVIKKLAASSQ